MTFFRSHTTFARLVLAALVFAFALTLQAPRWPSQPARWASLLMQHRRRATRCLCR